MSRDGEYVVVLNNFTILFPNYYLNFLGWADVC